MNSIIGMAPEAFLAASRNGKQLPAGVASLGHLESIVRQQRRSPANRARAERAFTNYEAFNEAYRRGEIQHSRPTRPRVSSREDRERRLAEAFAGVERCERKHRLSDAECQAAAVHEAGHVVAFLSLGICANSTIDQEGNGQAWSRQLRTLSPIDRATVAVAGALAEARHRDGNFHNYREYVSDLDRETAGDVPTFFQGVERARAILKVNRVAVDLIAFRLKHDGEISGSKSLRLTSNVLKRTR